MITRPYALPEPPPNTYYSDPPDPSEYGGNIISFEEVSDSFDKYTYRMKNVVYQGKTKYQHVLIGDTINYGRILVLDGAIQSSQDDEHLYHELLVQPAMLGHKSPKEVLIIGGGEGATLREVLVHSTVQSATMVDLDREVVEICREHLPSWHRGAFEDHRTKLIFGDGRKFVEEDNNRYDVVIIDVVDMLDNGPAQSLYTSQFYKLLSNLMREDAIVAIQGLEFSYLDDKPHAALLRTLKTVFSEVHTYTNGIPSFLSSWGFIVASNWFRPSEWSSEAIDQTIEKRLGSGYLEHIDGEFLKGCFALSKETKTLLAQPGPILEDNVEFIPPPDLEDIEIMPLKFPVKE